MGREAMRARTAALGMDSRPAAAPQSQALPATPPSGPPRVPSETRRAKVRTSLSSLL